MLCSLRIDKGPIILKLIIAGSRHLTADIETMDMCLEYHGLEPTEIICGMAKGIDMCGKEYGEFMRIPVREFPADWNGPLKKGAGHARNRAMAEYGDALLLIWDRKSTGSANMLRQMDILNKPVYEIVL